MTKPFHAMLAATVVVLCLPAAPAMAKAASAAAPADAAVQDTRLAAFLDKEFDAELALRPQLATRLGRKEGMDRLDDNSDAGILRRLEWRRGSVARMKAAFVRDRLSAEGRINYDIWALELERAELQYRFRRYQPPFYSFLYSAHAEVPNFLINTHLVQDAADMAAYIARVKATPAMLDTAIAQSTQSAAIGVLPPRFQLERVISGSQGLITGAPFDDGAPSPLWADAQAKIAKLVTAKAISADQATALTAQAREAILALKPAYQRVIAWAQASLPNAKSGVVGAGTLPGGADWYAAALRLNTTTALTPEQIHQTGLAEVTRINAAEDALARKAGFADAAALRADLVAKDPPRPWTDELRAARLAKSNAIVNANRALLPKVFTALPAYGTEVVREPAFSEVAGGAAHAAYASADGKRPGRVWLHMLGEKDPDATLYTLMCHEGIPGHLMQGDIQVRQTGTPQFRKAYTYVAFNEGWALYAERLCSEMGAFPDAAADLERLDAELFRAARLVVDTGIHAKGWSEDQAVQYLIDTAHLPAQQARSEVRRYITLPGQATGYKVGMLEIVALREKAQGALGARFDLRRFNDLVVSAGSVPLSVLGERVDAWVAAQGA
ncbi:MULTISPECIES: DUF885 domain-containing protein [unclassified Novosphingobium]|uniref:DUF885 domain-containing protein n=1 Tax=unclassified Novosphingobium TaxID=2644732 RepID=UPI001831D6A5|nr:MULTISPECIES: DUF885 domain-containing protein [unclassified Novosphingobium]NMN04184.1 uncharacterized protein (DUF885 family) [Novosphingobium sp. SG919]NMN85824.1 uncharacterized protein (DUF885 family) [Novosphingobium sp. SG916]